MTKKTLTLMIALCAIGTPFAVRGDSAAYAGSGGTFSTGTAVGSKITVSNVPLAGTTAVLSLPVP